LLPADSAIAAPTPLRQPTIDYAMPFTIAALTFLPLRRQFTRATHTGHSWAGPHSWAGKAKTRRLVIGCWPGWLNRAEGQEGWASGRWGWDTDKGQIGWAG